MSETIILNITNNTLAEFKLVLPDNAYNITVNGSEHANTSIVEEIACEHCIAEIQYFFPNITLNSSGNYTFYRKVDLPLNITDLSYKIVLPEDYEVINISDNEFKLFPTPKSMTWNSFEWYYENPEFPKEFGVMYKIKPVEILVNTSITEVNDNITNVNDNITNVNDTTNYKMNYFMPLAGIILVIILILIIFMNKKKIR
jgi:hypothetical protein